MKERKIRLAQAAILAAIALVILLVSFFGKGKESVGGDGQYRHVTDLNGKPIAVVTGSAYVDYAQEAFPDSELIYVTDWSDTSLLVSQGKAEALLSEPVSLPELLSEYPALAAFPDPIGRMEYSFVTQHNAKGKALAEEFDVFLAEYKASGAYDALHEKWVEADRTDGEPALLPCASDGKKGSLRVAGGNDWLPYCYVSDGENIGLFLDIVYRFCEWAGYAPELEIVPFEAGFMGVASGKYDMFAYGYIYSPERAEEVSFTAPLEGDDVLVLARKVAMALAEYTDFRQLDGKVFAEEVGTIGESIVRENFPNATLLPINGFSERLLSVELGKADAVVCAGTENGPILESFPGLTMLETDLAYPEGAFITAKNDHGRAVAAEFNRYLASIEQSDGFNAAEARWNSAKDGADVMPDYVFTGEKGELRIGVNSSIYPYTYVGENGLSGYEVDLAKGFCAFAGYTPVLEDVAFSSLVMGLNSGKYDLLAVNAVVTAERKETLNFTDAISPAEPITLAVRSGTGSAAAEEEGFLAGLQKSFEKNFIRESRWKMMLSGICVTIALALCAAVFGTLIGALVCLLRRSENPFATGFARLYVDLFRGIPIVVLLLILYYIVFSKPDASAFAVCALGFSLDFGAYAAEIFRSGIEAVSAGQQRAALALGFSRPAAFRNVVLPQAMRHILPVYRGQFIAMVKTTAVAGYISVEDLTKVSDIIRSRTYEAFFPLITTAVIYYLLAALLISMLRLVELRTDPLQRSRAPKGVKLQ